jgi:hypothetical protein
MKAPKAVMEVTEDRCFIKVEGVEGYRATRDIPVRKPDLVTTGSSGLHLPE